MQRTNQFISFHRVSLFAFIPECVLLGWSWGTIFLLKHHLRDDSGEETGSNSENRGSKMLIIEEIMQAGQG